MFEKEYWENQLKDLDLNDLNELGKLINKFKKNIDKRPEFIEVLKKWQKKYPETKLFYCGGAGKGAYECEGEWSVYNWLDIRHSTYDMLYDLTEYEPEDEEYEYIGDIELLKQFNNVEEFENACLNNYIKTAYDNSERKEFENDMKNSKHAPHYILADAEDLCNGETFYEFIDIETGKTYCLYTNAY